MNFLVQIVLQETHSFNTKTKSHLKTKSTNKLHQEQ